MKFEDFEREHKKEIIETILGELSPNYDPDAFFEFAKIITFLLSLSGPALGHGDSQRSDFLRVISGIAGEKKLSGSDTEKLQDVVQQFFLAYDEKSIRSSLTNLIKFNVNILEAAVDCYKAEQKKSLSQTDGQDGLLASLGGNIVSIMSAGGDEEVVVNLLKKFQEYQDYFKEEKFKEVNVAVVLGLAFSMADKLTTYQLSINYSKEDTLIADHEKIFYQDLYKLLQMAKIFLKPGDIKKPVNIYDPQSQMDCLVSYDQAVEKIGEAINYIEKLGVIDTAQLKIDDQNPDLKKIYQHSIYSFKDAIDTFLFVKSDDKEKSPLSLCRQHMARIKASPTMRDPFDKHPSLPQTPAPLALDSGTNSFSPLGDFMHQMCFDERIGYYRHLSGDLGFTTIANNSCKFSFAASLLSKAVAKWREHKEPKNFVMLQLSGGTGELELIILQMAEIMAHKYKDDKLSPWADFYKALNFRTMEISKSLAEGQREVCNRYIKSGKHQVIIGDATSKEDWAKVAGEKAGAYFVFSNELLDMLFPQFYSLSKGRIVQPCVVTKIGDIDEFREAMKAVLEGDKLEECKQIIRKIKYKQEALKKEVIAKAGEKIPKHFIENQGYFVDTESYIKLASLIPRDRSTESKKCNACFEHSVINFSANLSAEEEVKLRGELQKENTRFVHKDNAIPLLTRSQKIVDLFDLSLGEKEDIYHLDYFHESTNPGHQGLNMPRHFGRALGGKSSFMLRDEGAKKDNPIIAEFIYPDPYAYDITISAPIVEDRVKFKTHGEFIDDATKSHLQQITKVFGINENEFTSQERLGYVSTTEHEKEKLVNDVVHNPFAFPLSVDPRRMPVTRQDV